ncbi:MAG: class I SAM-dependent methyltransferase [Bacillota bacterium]|nr:class I SAM-dependent methyltransferase [Bacillota bacterium]
MNIRFTKRMQSIIDMVPPSVTVADIGADHALVSVNLIISGKAQKVFACDINEGPVKTASYNIERFNLSGKVFPVLSDGLEKVWDKAETVIIAGMGGELILSILRKSNLNLIKNFVLQPMNHANILRAGLVDLGLKIETESLVSDYGRVYCIIRAVHGITKYNDEELYVGPCILRQKGELFERHLNKIIRFEKSKEKDIINGKEHGKRAQRLEAILKEDTL